MVGRHPKVSRYVTIASVWAILETLVVAATIILERSGLLGYQASVLNYPLSMGFWIIFGVASFVGCYLGDDLEGLAKALFLSQLAALALSVLITLAVAPPIEPNFAFAAGFPSFEAGYLLVLGLLLFTTSMAGSFSGWVLNSLVSSNQDFAFDRKRLISGLALAVISISLPISPLIAGGEPLVAASVAGIALLSAAVVRSGLNRRVSIDRRPVGLLAVAGMLVFLLSAFSVSYILWFYASDRIVFLFWAQCVTLIAPSLILFRLLVRVPRF